jgi:xylulokinase
VVATATAAYPLLTPQPGWTEQDPEARWRANCEVLRDLRGRAPAPIEPIGLTGQMLLDGDDCAIRAGDPVERSAHKQSGV